MPTHKELVLQEQAIMAVITKLRVQLPPTMHTLQHAYTTITRANDAHMDAERTMHQAFKARQDADMVLRTNGSTVGSRRDRRKAGTAYDTARKAEVAARKDVAHAKKAHIAAEKAKHAIERQIEYAERDLRRNHRSQVKAGLMAPKERSKREPNPELKGLLEW